MTREPYFYKKIHDIKFMGDTTQDYQKFGVLIGNARMNQKVHFPHRSITDKISPEVVK